jgi:hypothetical protein
MSTYTLLVSPVLPPRITIRSQDRIMVTYFLAIFMYFANNIKVIFKKKKTKDAAFEPER